MLITPASSCNCGRLFRELGDLLKPERRAVRNELLTALQLVKTWLRAGFTTKPNSSGGGRDEDGLPDENLVRDYDTQE